MLNKINFDCCKDEMLKDKLNNCESESFLFFKNYSEKAPTNNFFEICKLQILIFDKYFKINCYQPKIKINTVNLCITETNKIDKFKDWFSPTNKCNEHHKKILNFLILVLIRNNATWLAQKLILKENSNDIGNNI